MPSTCVEAAIFRHKLDALFTKFFLRDGAAGQSEDDRVRVPGA
jgi:hypothetical protein